MVPAWPDVSRVTPVSLTAFINGVLSTSYGRVIDTILMEGTCAQPDGSNYSSLTDKLSWAASRLASPSSRQPGVDPHPCGTARRAVVGANVCNSRNYVLTRPSLGVTTGVVLPSATRPSPCPLPRPHRRLAPNGTAGSPRMVRLGVDLHEAYPKIADQAPHRRRITAALIAGDPFTHRAARPRHQVNVSC